MATFRSTLAVFILLYQTQTLRSQKLYDCKNFIKVKLHSSDKPLLLHKLFNASVYASVNVLCLEVILSSAAPSGHVCLLQLKNVRLYRDIPNTLDLEIFDDTKELEGIWDIGEYCTDSNTLTARLIKYNGKHDYKKDELIGLSTLVYNMQTPQRQIFTIPGFCDSDLKLYNGRIILYDKYPVTSVVKNRTLVTNELCAIHFFNIPKKNPFCAQYTILPREGRPFFYWKLILSTTLVYDYNRLLKEAVFSFGAESNISASWCDSVVREKLTLVYETTKTKFLDSDPPIFKMYLSTEKYKSNTQSSKQTERYLANTTKTPDNLRGTTDYSEHTVTSTTDYSEQTISKQTSTNISSNFFRLTDKNSKIIFYSFVACLLCIMILSMICFLAKPRSKPKTQGEDIFFYIIET